MCLLPAGVEVPGVASEVEAARAGQTEGPTAELIAAGAAGAPYLP